LKHVQDLLKNREEELLMHRQRSNSFPQQVIELSKQISELRSRLEDTTNKFNDFKEKHKDYSNELIERRKDEKHSKRKRRLEMDHEQFDRRQSKSRRTSSMVEPKSQLTTKSTVQLTQAYSKAMTKWSGEQPTALETLVHPIECQSRPHKPILFQKAAAIDSKVLNDNRSLNILETPSIEQICNSFKNSSFLLPPLSPIPFVSLNSRFYF
jgi:chromosome segregation ATPase